MALQRESWTWNSARLPAPARVVRWGHFGTPVLLFPSAGGDFEEVERFHLVQALNALIEAGRIKVFSIDGIAGKAWLRGTNPSEQCAHAQSLYEAYVHEEVVPHIRRDCHSDTIEIITAGAAIGAFNAVAHLCRHPEVFRAAIGMSGTYDLSGYLQGGFTPGMYAASPLHYLPDLSEGSQLDALRHRFVQLATGEGTYEVPEQSRRMAGTLAGKRIPNRLDLWGREHAHAWSTWREMLPKYLTALA